MPGGEPDRSARPAGFPACARCPLLRDADPAVCLQCCLARFPLPVAYQCPVCDVPLGPGESCGNDWCGRADRWFSVVWSVGPHVGPWRRVIGRYKYRHELGWAAVLGRVLLGYLDDHMPWFDDFDHLVPMPAYLGVGAHRTWDQVARITDVAARLAGPRWQFRPGLVIKDFPTVPLTGLSRHARTACAEGPLRRALRVPEPRAVQGGRFLVVDDVFTEGSTLREVARALMLAGADEVAAVVLARQPWQPRRRARVGGEPGSAA